MGDAASSELRVVEVRSALPASAACDAKATASTGALLALLLRTPLESAATSPKSGGIISTVTVHPPPSADARGSRARSKMRSPSTETPLPALPPDTDRSTRVRSRSRLALKEARVAESRAAAAAAAAASAVSANVIWIAMSALLALALHAGTEPVLLAPALVPAAMLTKPIAQALHGRCPAAASVRNPASQTH